MLAGRGAGKTRASAETLASWAWEQPNTRWLVSAPTSGDLKGTCFEGDSGLISVIPPALVAKYNSSLHEIHLINGSFIKGIPASEPERFRGPQFHGGWLDELAAWEYLRESWDMIQFGIRLGQRTKLICSTTPKPKDVVMELIDREGDDVVITRASTYSNMKNLAPSFQKQILQYEGTNLGRQEIHAEIIDPEEGGIVRREWFKLWPSTKPFPKLEYIIQSYDCATSDKTVNDPTGCITLGAFKPMDGGMCVMVLDCWQEHLQYPDLRPKVIEEYDVVYGEGIQHRAGAAPPGEVSMTDDRVAHARAAIEAAGALRGDAVHIFDLAHDLQLVASPGLVEGAALHEDRADNVVATGRVGVQLVEGVIGRERDAGDEMMHRFGEGAHQRTQVPQVVVRIDDRQIWFQDRFAHGVTPLRFSLICSLWPDAGLTSTDRPRINRSIKKIVDEGLGYEFRA